MTACEIHGSGTIELYFYDELPPGEREAIERHLALCADCRAEVEDLRTIRAALASRPMVLGPASGDWSGFMSRLQVSIDRERRGGASGPVLSPPSRSYVGYLALAALLTLVTLSVVVAFRARHAPVASEAMPAVEQAMAGEPAAELARRASLPDIDAFKALSEEHFERSKLVVLGLAAKDPGRQADWTYERGLASSLLDDTRLYRLAAEDRGLDELAGVMRDLETVLLQTSLTNERDPASLPQIQRLIRKRDLIGKMDLVAATGL